MTLSCFELFRNTGFRSDRKWVATNGCFDVLHIGHIRFLKKAKELGRYLVVGLNDDESIRSLKGEGRPIFTVQEREEMLLSLRCVDFVAVFNGNTATEFLRICRPDVWVKGGEWTMETLNEEEKKEVLVNGGTIQILPRMSEWSTTSVLKALG